MQNLQLVKPLPINIQARLAIARHRAERNGAKPLTAAEVARVDDLTLVERIAGEITIDNYDWRWQFTWRNVLDCKLAVNLAGASRAAKDAGYRFFAFGGAVYFVSVKGLVEETGILVADLR